MVLAGFTLASGGTLAAPIAWSWTGTVADWAAAGGGTGVVTDGDGDAAFKYLGGSNLPVGMGGYVTLSETEIGSVDYYDVGVTWDSSTGFPGGYAGGGRLMYSMTVLGASNERIVSAALDSVITGIGTTATSALTDLPGHTVFANLSTQNGAHDPLNGYLGFAGRTTLGVDTAMQTSTTGVFQDVHNSFAVAGTAVPEPGTLALLGLALSGVVITRRRTQ